MTMRLGTDTGSLINHLYSRTASLSPEIGMGATICHWTDRSAGTVSAISQSGKGLVVTVQEDKATRSDKNGMNDGQSYSFERNHEGRTWNFRLGKDGNWQEVWFNMDSKRWVKTGGVSLVLGRRDKYHDFSF